MLAFTVLASVGAEQQAAEAAAVVRRGGKATGRTCAGHSQPVCRSRSAVSAGTRLLCRGEEEAVPETATTAVHWCLQLQLKLPAGNDRTVQAVVICKAAVADGDANTAVSVTVELPTTTTTTTSLAPKLEYYIREAHVEESWHVADLHCSGFYPKARPPYTTLLRAEWVFQLLQLQRSSSYRGACLVAMDRSMKGQVYSDERSSPWPLLEYAGRELWLWMGEGNTFKGSQKPDVTFAGAVTIDTSGMFVKRKRCKRRLGYAYLGNLAVQPLNRRQGLGRMLVLQAEQLARDWSCTKVFLHCDRNDPAAWGLYRSCGYRLVRVPKGASWPMPNVEPGSGGEIVLMMKRLNVSNTSSPDAELDLVPSR
eukprot:jgi/Chlat1/7285/Chrsp58S00883